MKKQQTAKESSRAALFVLALAVLLLVIVLVLTGP